jgi:15-cis-phytoene synthase
LSGAGPDAPLAEHLAPLGSEDYYLARLHAPEARATVAVLLALEQQFQRLLLGEGDSGVLRLKLGWWQQTLHDWQPGAVRHPLLLHLETAPRLPLAHYRSLLAAAADAVETRLRWTQPATLEVAWQNFLDFEGRFGQLRAEAAAGAVAPAPNLLQQISAGTAWSASLQEAHALARKGVSLIPAASARAAGFDLDALLARPSGAAFIALAEAHVAHGFGAAATAARKLTAPWHAAALSARIRLALAQATLALVAEGGFAIYRERLSLTPLRRLLIAARVHWWERPGLSP